MSRNRSSSESRSSRSTSRSPDKKRRRSPDYSRSPSPNIKKKQKTAKSSSISPGRNHFYSSKGKEEKGDSKVRKDEEENRKDRNYGKDNDDDFDTKITDTITSIDNDKLDTTKREEKVNVDEIPDTNGKSDINVKGVTITEEQAKIIQEMNEIALRKKKMKESVY